jgi:hypothetical protein
MRIKNRMNSASRDWVIHHQFGDVLQESVPARQGLAEEEDRPVHVLRESGTDQRDAAQQQNQETPEDQGVHQAGQRLLEHPELGQKHLDHRPDSPAEPIETIVLLLGLEHHLELDPQTPGGDPQSQDYKYNHDDGWQ